MQPYEIVAEGAEAEGAEKVYIVTIPMPTADKEYHRIIHDVKGIRLQCRDGTAFRFAFEQDKVASATPNEPYHTVLANGHVTLRGLNVEELHLYLACGVGAKVAEIIVWE